MASLPRSAPAERSTGGRVLRGLLATAALGWAVTGLVLALLSVLPTPDLRVFWANIAVHLVAAVVQGYSLLLAAFAVPGLALAAFARRTGLRRTAFVAAVLAVTTVVLSLVPVVQGWRTGSHEGVRLSLSEYLSLPTGDPSETVTYARPDGEGLKLDVWLPAGGGASSRTRRVPAVVMVHGGGGLTGSRGEDALWAAWLADRGYAVFSIDYRLGLPPRWEDATGDVKCAVGWVREHARRYRVDPRRTALLGRSFGGHVALLAAYTEGDQRLTPSCEVPDTGVEAVAAFYAPTDLVRLQETQWPWWRPSLAGSVTDSTGSDVDFVAEGDRRLASPVSHVDSGDPPTFLAHGTHDQISPLQQSVLLEASLAEAGVPHRLVELPGARHGFDLAWGGWDTQVVRQELGRFLEHSLAEQEPLRGRTPTSRPPGR